MSARNLVVALALLHGLAALTALAVVVRAIGRIVGGLV